MLAARMSRIASSPTMKGTVAAENLRKQGFDVVDLGAGEPDFPTPEHVKLAGKRAIDANFTKYTANAGTSELKQAIVARYRADYGVDYAENQVIITAGGKQSLANAILALFGPGDEVITHAPGWPTIPEQIKLADATPVIVHAHAENGFTLTADLFLNAVTPRTKGIVINSPANPTGALISEDELTKVAKFAAGKGIWVMIDLCYEKLIYEPVPHNLPGVLQRELRDRSVVSGSASKAYAMTGWRCGWTIAPKEVGRRLRRAPEPSDVERLLDHAARGRRGAERPAGMRHRNARGIPHAPRRGARLADGRSAHQVREARGRVLSVHRHLRTAVAERRAHVRRIRRSPDQRVVRGDDSW